MAGQEHDQRELYSAVKKETLQLRMRPFLNQREIMMQHLEESMPKAQIEKEDLLSKALEEMIEKKE